LEEVKMSKRNIHTKKEQGKKDIGKPISNE
jgi:hypothetical protein